MLPLLHTSVAGAWRARDDPHMRLAEWLRDHRPPAPIVATARPDGRGDADADRDDVVIDVRVYAGVAAYPYRAGQLGSALGAGVVGWGLTSVVLAASPLAFAVAAGCSAGWYAFVRRPGFRHVRYPTCAVTIDRADLHARAGDRETAIVVAEIDRLEHDLARGELHAVLQSGERALVWRGLRAHAEWIEALVAVARAPV
jgi:hypothetical protein